MQKLIRWAVVISVIVTCRFVRATAVFTDIGDFARSNFSPIGIQPEGGVYVNAQGDLFGTTYQGGFSGQGTAYQILAGSKTITTLATFSTGSFPLYQPGANPSGPLVTDAQGNLYGTTSQATGQGTIFKISAAAGHSVSTLINPPGSITSSPVFDSSGDMYVGAATTTSTGAIYELAAGATAFTTFATFASHNYPNSLMLDKSGDLFGTIGGSSGLNVNGSVFEIAAGSSLPAAPTTLAAFSATDARYPIGGLTMDAAGNLFGETLSNAGQTVNLGAIYEVPAGGHVVNTLYTFSNGSISQPVGGLIDDAAGNLFGVASVGGGPNLNGEVFEFNPYSQTLTDVYDFTSSEGGSPQASVTADAAGNLYGTLSFGGNNGNGSAFELTSTGFVTSVPEPVAILPGAIIAVLAMLRRKPYRVGLPAHRARWH